MTIGAGPSMKLRTTAINIRLAMFSAQPKADERMKTSEGLRDTPTLGSNDSLCLSHLCLADRFLGIRHERLSFQYILTPCPE